MEKGIALNLLWPSTTSDAVAANYSGVDGDKSIHQDTNQTTGHVRWTDHRDSCHQGVHRSVELCAYAGNKANKDAR